MIIFSIGEEVPEYLKKEIGSHFPGFTITGVVKLEKDASAQEIHFYIQKYHIKVGYVVAILVHATRPAQPALFHLATKISLLIRGAPAFVVVKGGYAKELQKYLYTIDSINKGVYQDLKNWTDLLV